MRRLSRIDARGIEDFPDDLRNYQQLKMINNFSFQSEFGHLKDNIKYYAEKKTDEYDSEGFFGKYRNIVYSERAFANDITVKLRAYYFDNDEKLSKDIFDSCQKIYDYIQCTKTLYVTAYVLNGELFYQKTSRRPLPDFVRWGMN